jgi:hypothetical protein
MDKWVAPLESTPCKFTSVISYENLTGYLRDLVSMYGGFVKANDQARLDAAMSQLEAGFKPRQDPFSNPSPRLMAYLQENASVFSGVASELDALPSFKWAVTRV